MPGIIKIAIRSKCKLLNFEYVLACLDQDGKSIREGEA